jgi:uncharacterized protein YerC
MDIGDAFTQEAIAAAGIGDSDEDELRELIEQIFTTNEVEFTRDHVNVAVLCFVAGRTYQDGETRIQLDMSPRLINAFMEFLSERGL